MIITLFAQWRLALREAYRLLPDTHVLLTGVFHPARVSVFFTVFHRIIFVPVVVTTTEAGQAYRQH